MAKTATDEPGATGSVLLEETEVWELVWPLVSSGAAPRPKMTVTVHRLRDDGRVVAEYDNEPAPNIVLLAFFRMLRRRRAAG